jgi:magnesium transporter
MLAQADRALLEGITDLNQLKSELNDLPPIDVGDYIAALDNEPRAIAFRLLQKDKATEVFEYLPKEVREELIASLQGEQMFQIVDSMSPDDRAKLFDELPAKVVKKLIAQLSPQERQATSMILGYPEGTAGRVMTTEYVRLRQGLTVGQAIEKIKQSDQDKETIYYAYVTNDNRKLKQVVSLRQLLFSIPDALIGDIASDRVIKANTHMPQEEVALLMQRYDLLALPVVDQENRLVGIVTIDDVVDILADEATEDLQKFAGGGGDESVLATPRVAIFKRLPWLMGNIALYLGAASAIAPFQSTISLVPVLAVIMPILSNTSGNVGIQSLSVTVRGLGIGEVSPRDTLKIVNKEVMAGLGMALVLGLTLAVLSLIWSSSEENWVALVAGSVMAVNVVVAAALGAVLPMGLKKLNLDPALISGPLLTTILDAVGFLTFLTLISTAIKVLGMSTPA